MFPPPARGRCHAPTQGSGAIRVGVRHARHNPHLRSTLIRAAAFFLFASGYWALLPLLARQQIAGGPALYGYCSRRRQHDRFTSADRQQQIVNRFPLDDRPQVTDLVAP